ncbi:MAG: hypothetical protein Q7R70_03000 [Candidatus Diapherotrites archaeon]|nr:hypothetical protein [Candidatus Diapherotrites archaeon]
MAELLVVTSKVKEAISKADMNCSSDTPDALSAHVDAVIQKAVARAKANGRKTVRPEDF